MSEEYQYPYHREGFQLPLNHQVVRRFSALSQSLKKSEALCVTAKEIVQLWNKTDCPPQDAKVVNNKVQSVINREYQLIYDSKSDIITLR